MSQDVLAVTCPVTQSTQQTNYLVVQSPDIGLDGGFFAKLQQLMVDVLFGLGDKLFDPGRMYSSILYEPLHRETGDFASDWIKSADNNHTGSIIYNDIYAGRLLKCTNIASLSADDSTLHIVAGYLDS